MRHLSLAAVVLTSLAACQNEPQHEPKPLKAESRNDAVFVNGDFEDGGLAGWTVSTFQNKGITYPPLSRTDLKLLSGGTNRTRVVTGDAETLIPAGLDGGASLRVPKYGRNAVVVNELGSGYNVNTLVQQFVVGASDVDPADNKVHVRFALAPVLNSGGHGPADQPYFWVTLTNVTKGATLFGTFNFADQAGVPWQVQGSNYYTDWQSFDIAPGNVALALGDTVRLEVIGAGCSQSGHWGEVYVDGFGAFLPGLQVAASAPQSANAGTNLTYTVNYQNRGTGTAANTLVTFTLPANVAFQSVSAPDASCTTPSSGATTGQVVCNVGALNPNAAGSFGITVKILSTATGKISAGNYSIRADGVTPLIGPLVETNITAGVSYADLSATLSDSVAAVGWGQAYGFTFTIANAGPTAANNAPVTWSMPAQLASATWTCAGTGTCGAASGSGSIASTVSLPAGTSVTYTVNATLIAGSSSGSMSNLVTVAPPAGVTDNTSSNNQAIDTNAIGTLRTITFAKSGTGSGRVVTSPAAIDCAAGCSGASTSFIDGTVVSVTATATAGDSFAGWSGLCTGAANPCSFTVAGNGTLTAAFTAPSSTITASAGAGGSISPSGAVSVAHGASQTFTIAPALGYSVADVLVDGASVGAVGSYTFSNVTAPRSIAASFALQTFAVSSSVSGGDGSITGSQTVAYGGSATFTIAAAAHHHIVDVLVDAVSVGAVGSYTFSNVTAPHTIAAAFAIDTFLISSSAGANGSISASQPVQYGGSATFTITPAPHHHIADVKVDGQPVGAVSSYTFDDVTQKHSISATFAIDTFALTSSAGANGSISASQTVEYGGSATFTITPAPHHHIADVLVDGQSVGAVSSYTFSSVTGAHGISATFAIDTFLISSSAGPNGGISPSKTVDSGASASFTITPDAHHHIADVLVDGESVGAVGAYTFEEVRAAHSIAASFAIDTFEVTGTGDANGSVVCTSPVAYGATSTCDITPAQGYELVSLFDDGQPAAAEGATYAAQNVTGARAITATFKLSRGLACASSTECGSGQCVDGVCCNSACNGQCEACDVEGHAGECTPVAGAPRGSRTACDSDGTVCGGYCDGSSRDSCSYPGAATACRAASCEGGLAIVAASCNGQGACPAEQTIECAPFICGGAACAGDCATDSDCTSGNWCAAGKCEPKKLPGSTCGANNECGSGFCTDGVCCNVACGGQCEACDVAGSVGTCSPVSGAPHAGRPECASDSTVCGGTCDGERRDACAYPTASTQCRAPSCASGVATLAAACDGQGACPAEQTRTCAPFICGAHACLGDCKADSDCQEGSWCEAGACTPKKLPGGSCAADNECGSGFCTDGVCCSSACEGQCQACDVPGKAGTCVPVSGAPHGERPACESDGSACGGACNGEDVTACAYPIMTCREASCADGVATLGASCNAGRCPAPQQQGCQQFACGVEACNGDCSVDSDCAAGNWCSAGLCVPQRALGGSCSADSQCGGGHCVDGVCCNTACDGQCEACDVAGSVGTCAPVAGAPHGGRAACASDGSMCGGTCDGTKRDSCSFPSAAVECVTASCTNGVETHASACTGTGACAAPQTALCGAFACGEAACRASCSSDADCDEGLCAAGVCQPKGDPEQWKVQGGVGFGCQSTGGELTWLGLAVLALSFLTRRRVATSGAAAMIGAAVLWSAPAQAQSQLESSGVSRSFLLERYAPQLGEADILGVQSPSISAHLMPRISAWASYADVPLRALMTTDDGVQQMLAANQTTLTLGGSIGLFDRVELGFAVPVVITQSLAASSIDARLSDAGSQVSLSDVRVQAKARFFDVGPFTFGASLPVTLPTAGSAPYAGSTGVTVAPTLLAQWSGPRRSAVLLDLGVMLRQPQQLLNLTVGNALTWSAAGKIDLVPRADLSVMASVGGEIGLVGTGAVQNPLEALVALRWMPIRGLALTLGAGPGLTQGYGTPRFRVVGSIAWIPPEPQRSVHPAQSAAADEAFTQPLPPVDAAKPTPGA